MNAKEMKKKIQNGVANIAEVWNLYIKIRSNGANEKKSITQYFESRKTESLIVPNETKKK